MSNTFQLNKSDGSVINVAPERITRGVNNYRFNKDDENLEDIWKSIINRNSKTLPYNSTFTFKDMKKLQYKFFHIIGIGSHGDSYSFSFSIDYPLTQWKYPFTVLDFYEKLKASLTDALKIKNINTIKSSVEEEDSNGILTAYFKMTLSLKHGYIEKDFETLQKLINETADKLINSLMSDENNHLFLKIFNFPPEYANICSQYLMWFGEFLKNLGIEAEVSTQNKDGKTSLIVSPAENGEMLEQIEQLFYQYLSLPYAELLPPEREMSIQEQHTFMAVKQQIQSLEMQVESKDFLLMNSKATIASLYTTIATKDALLETQADKLTLVNALVDKDKWSNVPFTEGTFKCKNFGKKTMSIQFEPLAVYNKLITKSDEPK